jgi:mRNA interferase HicA
VFIIGQVKSSKFKRWLDKQGATFRPGKGSHLKVTLDGRNSVLPMHNKELGTGLLAKIKKDLGLK